MNARITDPQSSRETVAEIVADARRLKKSDLKNAIRALPMRHFNDDDITAEVEKQTGLDVDRGHIARRRLELERDNPPFVVRVSELATPRADGTGTALHFRRADDLDLPRGRPTAETRSDEPCPHCGKRPSEPTWQPERA